MNKIFKVIWSTSRQCYVVVSEVANNKSGKKKIVVASILAALAAQSVGMMDVAAADVPSTAIANAIPTTGKTNGFAAGNEAQAKSNQSVAIGYRSSASAANPNAGQADLPATAVGAGANADGKAALALGLASSATERGTAVGSSSKADGFGSFAGGVGAQAQGRGAVAIGGGSTATYNNTTGYVYNDNAAATASDAVAIGTGAKAEESNAISIGYHSNAKAGNSLAVGSNAAATGEGSVAVGRNNTASGASAVAMGILANATGTSSTALGMQATASGNNTVAIGPSAKAIADDSIAVGTNNTVAEKGVAIGKNVKAKASTYENMVVGIDSEASGAGGAMAVGMKVKTTGMDAVTVGRESQATGAWGVAVGRKANATGATSVALGTDVTANGGNSAAMGSNATSSGPGSLAIGSGTGDATTALGANAIAVGTSSVAATGNAIAMGNGAVANGSDAIVIGRASKTESTANTVQAIVIGSNAYVGPQTAQSIAIGSGNHAGQGATVTGDQSIAIGGNVIVPGHSAIAIGGDDVIKAMNATVTYTSKDGQTISNQNLRAAYGALTGKNITGFVRTTASHGGVAYGVSAKAGNGGVAVGMGADSYTRAGSTEQPLTNAVALGMGARATLDNSVAIGGGSNTDHSATSQTHAVVNGIEVHWQGGANIKPGDVVSFGGDGYERQLKNVAPGEVSATSTDAVNGSQLFSVANTAFTNTWKLSANGDATTETINKGETVDFSGDNNITIDRTGKKITTKLNKTINLDAVNVGSVTGNRASLTANGLSATAGTTTVKFGADEINAGGKQIKNVSSGGNIGTNAANITDVKNAVAGVNLKLTDGSHNGTVNLDQDTLRIASGTGINASVNGKSISVALNKDGQTALTSGIGLRGNSGATGYKYLKDGNVAFDIKGDGSLVTTSASPAGGVSIAVNGDKVKDIALTAVTASSDVRQQNNPIKVSPIAGTHSMDYAISIDRDKLAKITDLTYRANSAADANAKKISLAKGLDFVDGTSTSASINTDGKVSFDLNSATKTKIDTTATAVGRNITLAAEAGTPSSQSLTNGNVSFAVTGAANDYISTKMNGSAVEIATKRATITSNPTTGQASVTGADGLATAKNVADAINAAANRAAAGATWNVTTNSSAADTTEVSSGDTVDFVDGDNIEIKQDSSNKKKITVATKKNVSFDSATIGTNTTIGTAGITTNKVTAGNVTTDKVVVGPVSIDKNDGINAGNKQITNLASGGAVASNAATIGDVQNAVANLSQNLNITDGSNNGTVNLKTQTLTVTGTGAAKATVNGQTITVDVAEGALTSDTNGVVTGTTGVAKAPEVAAAINKVNTVLGDKIDQNKTDIATNARHIANTISLDGESGSTTAKSLKDGNVSFKIKGDGKYVTTDASGENVTVKVSEEAVKKSAVSAVTVSTDAAADNPLTVTGTTSPDGTSKEYKVSIDGSKLAAKTNLTYKANGTSKQVSLADGLDFTNGTMTTASVDDNGVVKYDVNTASITAGTDGTVTGPTTDGVATAKNVADAINAAKKASTTVITANGGESANGTSGSVKLTSTTGADGHTIYDVALNDAVTIGTGTNAIALDGTNGTITGKKAKMGDVTVNGDDNTITGLSNKTWNGTPVSGRAATEDQLKAVADAAANQTWKITADKVGTSGKQTGTKTDAVVGKDQTVQLVAGDNLTIDQDDRKFTYSLNKDLVNMTSASFEAAGGKTSLIKGDSITQSDNGKTHTSTASENTLADGNKSNKTTADGNTITDGVNTNTATATSNSLADNAGNSNVSNATSNTLKNAAGDQTQTEAQGVTVKDAAGNNTTLTKDGLTITKVGKAPVSLTSDGLNNGGNKISNIADGVADHDAVNVSQLNAKTKAATTELTANGGQAANGTNGNIVLKKTLAADGHTVYDNALNDTITLGASDPTKSVTLDGKTGKVTAGSGADAVAIDGTNGTVKAGDKVTLNGKDGKATIGSVGIDGKDGILTTGGTNPVAVNGKDGVVTGLTNKDWDPNNITSGRAATEDQVKKAVADSGWIAKVGTEGTGVNATPSANPKTIKTNETLAFNAGNNVVVSQSGKTISYALNPELKDMKSATFKDGDGNTTVTNGNGMTITPGAANPTNPNAGPVSLTKDGLNNGNNQLKGIAPGTDDTDAVNVAQLRQSNANISQAIDKVASETQRVGAQAAAMAALKPIQYDPLEPTQIMAGIGNYRGETAAALGLAHYTNENTMFNVGVSIGNNHNMVNAGVTHKFGTSAERKNIPDRYKAGPISSIYVMQDEMTQLRSENTAYKTKLEQQQSEIDALKEAVHQLLAAKA